MFDWLKRSTPQTEALASASLYFKGTNEAFQYACEYLDSDLNVDSVLPAIVVDAGVFLGGGSAVKVQSTGGQIALLRVCSKDGGFIHAAASASTNGPSLQPRDLVAWRVMQYTAQLIRSGDDVRTHWMGLIIARLRPEYTIGRGWAIEQLFET